MGFTININQLPLDTLPLFSRMFHRGGGEWRYVGILVRDAHGLVPTFEAEANVCQPAWVACARSFRGDANIQFAVVLPPGRGFHVISEGYVGASVSEAARAIGERAELRELAAFGVVPEPKTAEQKEQEAKRVALMKGGGPRPLRSVWPEASRIAPARGTR